MRIRTDLFYHVLRNELSMDFKQDKNYKYVGIGSEKNPFIREDYKNNIKNNMLDIVRLIYKPKQKDVHIIYECNQVQTVANYPLADVMDTVGLGDFQLKCFVKQGGYYQPIHAIVNAFDLEGQKINYNAMQWEDNHQKGRWLAHDVVYWIEKLKRWGFPDHAYSKGCFVSFADDQKYLNEILIKYGINNNPNDKDDDYDIIPGRVEIKKAS